MATIKVKEGNNWVKLPNIGVEQFPDAPLDGKPYNRKDGAWSESEQFPDAPLDGKPYARQDGAWVESSVDISKESVEKVLTGNIATHTHDRVAQVTDMPTDVWDGVTVSSALVGSGTADDPYLIRSCADYIHFYRNVAMYGHTIDRSTGPTPEQIANLKHIRFTSNLDMNNVEIDFDETVPNIDTPEPPSNGLYFSVIDGQGSILSNINFKNTWAAIPISAYCVIKNIHVQSGIFTVPLSIIHDEGFNYNESNKVGLQSFGLIGGLSEINNTSFTAEVKFTGDIESAISFVGGTVTVGELRIIITGYIEQPYSYANVTFSGDEGMINAVNIAYSPCAVDYEPGSPITCVHYDYTKALIDPETAPTAGVVVGMGIDFVTANPYTLYVNTDNATPIYSILPTPFHTAKTTAEMKSPGFLALLNGSTDTFIADTENVNEGYPVFKPKQTEVVTYDGYVKESVFEEFKNNMPEGASEFVEIPTAVVELTSSSTSDQIRDAFGGDAGFDDITLKTSNGAVPKISALMGTISLTIVCVYAQSVINDSDSGRQLFLEYSLIGNNKNIFLNIIRNASTNLYSINIAENPSMYRLASTSSDGLINKLNNNTSSFYRGDGVWATPPNTTYSLATGSKDGLMSSEDYTKLSRLGNYTTSSTVSSLNVNYETIYVNLNANASLSANLTGSAYDGYTTTAYVYTASARTITIPTSGSYVSMCGSSFTTTAGKWVEFNLTCVDGKWHIAKIEQE